MAVNAGMDTHEVVAFTKHDGIKTVGYNFKTKEIDNMFDAGIIDPFKVFRLALESATAIAMSLVSKEVAIVEEEEPSKDER